MSSSPIEAKGHAWREAKRRVAEPKVFPDDTELEEVVAAGVARAGKWLDRPPRPDLDLDALRKRIEAEGRILTPFTRRERKHIIWVLWRGPDPLAASPDFVRRYLEWATVEAPRYAHRVLWRAVLEHYRPDDHFCRETIPRLLQQQQDGAIHPAVGALLTAMGVLVPGIAHQTLARTLLLPDWLEQARGFSEAQKLLVAGSPLLRMALAETLSDPRTALMADLPEQIHRLLDVLSVNDAVTGPRSNGSPGTLARDVEPLLVAAMVRWVDRSGPADSTHQTRALRMILRLLPDPRFEPGRWQGIATGDTARVRAWLAAASFHAFFAVVDHIETERDDMWVARRRFWERYLPHVEGAWLIVAQPQEHYVSIIMAKFLNLENPNQARMSYGLFREQTANSSHCGLMLEIGPLTLLEMNHNGGLCFWQSGDPAMPSFYRRHYDRKGILRLCRDPSVSLNRRGYQAHHSGWEPKVETLIRERARIAPSPRGSVP